MSVATTQSIPPCGDASAAEVLALRAQVAQLQKQLDWFKRQVFGAKSERREFIDPQQLALGMVGGEAPAAPEAVQRISYERGKGKKQRGEDCINDTGLRFDDMVPVKTIRLPVPGLAGLSADQYELIEIKRTYKLAQRMAAAGLR